MQARGGRDLPAARVDRRTAYVWGDAVGGEREWRDGTDFGPPRFFSIRTDEAVQEALSQHGTVEDWLTWKVDGPMHYQWAILRTPS